MSYKGGRPITIQNKINTMRRWIWRQEAKSQNWTADELWGRIQKNWPTLSDADKEKIFQECDRRAT